MNIPHEHAEDGAPIFAGFLPAPEPDDGPNTDTFRMAVVAAKGDMIAVKNRDNDDPHPWDTPQGPRTCAEMAAQEWTPFVRGAISMGIQEQGDDAPLTPATADEETRLHAAAMVVASVLSAWVPPALREDALVPRITAEARDLVNRLAAPDLLGPPVPRPQETGADQ